MGGGWLARASGHCYFNIYNITFQRFWTKSCHHAQDCILSAETVHCVCIPPFACFMTCRSTCFMGVGHLSVMPQCASKQHIATCAVPSADTLPLANPRVFPKAKNFFYFTWSFFATLLLYSAILLALYAFSLKFTIQIKIDQFIQKIKILHNVCVKLNKLRLSQGT